MLNCRSTGAIEGGQSHVMSNKYMQYESILKSNKYQLLPNAYSYKYYSI